MKAMLLLSSLFVSLGLGYEVSLCPPGMDMGTDMATGGSMGAGSAQPASPVDGSHCRFSGSTNDDGRSACPLAVGGIGPCGTTVPAPALSFEASSRVFSSGLALVSDPPGHEDAATRVPLPPPRA